MAAAVNVALSETLVPRREFLTLLAYLETGSHKAGAHRLGVSESTSRQRVSALCSRLGVGNAAQAIWQLRIELEAEQAKDAAARL